MAAASGETELPPGSCQQHRPLFILPDGRVILCKGTGRPDREGARRTPYVDTRSGVDFSKIADEPGGWLCQVVRRPGWHPMAFIVWNDHLSVGIDSIDRDHKEMLKILDELYQSIQAGRQGEIIGALIDRLVDYTGVHFKREETLFEKIGYVDAAAHAHEHENMRAWVLETRARFHSGSLKGLSLEVVNYLKDWLFEHILTSDQKYVPYVDAHGSSELP